MKTNQKPYVMYGIFIVNTLVFAAQYLLPQLHVEQQLGMFSPSVAFRHEYWRFVTPMFIHFGLMHFALNAVVLVYMGKQCELIFGHARFALVYFLSGVMGNLASFAFNNPTTLSGGASTALFGLFGAFLVIGWHFRDNPAMQALTKQFALFIVLNFAFGIFDTTIDLWGHLGGVIGGALMGEITALPVLKERFAPRSRITAGIFFIFFAVICVLLGFKKLGLPV